MKELILLITNSRTCFSGVSLLIAFMAVASCNQITNHLDGRATNLSVSEMGVDGELEADKGVDSDDSYSFRIHCGDLITNRENPLYFVDGVEFNFTPGQNSEGETINPEDIESIEVIKGSEARAEYGAVGEHGVVLITTKKNVPVE